MASDSPEAKFAIVSITRTLFYDDHVPAGESIPEPDLTTTPVAFGYHNRPEATQPVIRTYTVTLAVPRNQPCSWAINPGLDYRLLIITRGFANNNGAISLDGRIKSNYQIQLGPDRAPMGPNSFGFTAQRIGEISAVEVLKDEAPGTIFREIDQTVIQSLSPTPTGSSAAAIPESEDAQKQRWQTWAILRKQSL